MKQFKGMPGPWFIEEIDDDDLSEMSSTMIVDVDGLMVACVGPSGNTCLEDDMKNADLIAASPELLEALQRCEAVLSVIPLEVCDVEDLLYARAAIAKALGETK